MRNLRLKTVAPAALLALLMLTPLAGVSMPRHNVPDGVGLGQYVGRVDPAKEMNLTITLKMHNEAEFDRVLEELYDPASTRYHQWLTPADYEKFAPTPAEFATVKNELLQHGFTVVTADQQRLWIRVHGTAEKVEKAFQTELHLFNYQGRTFQAHTRDAQLAGPAGDLINGIAGLERHAVRPNLSYLKNPLTGKPLTKKLANTPMAIMSFLGSFTATPLSQSATVPLTGSTANATYKGLQYAAGGKSGGLTPAQLQQHYGIPFKQGSKTFDGTGQTIALVEGYGYPTAMSDANVAASAFSLPALTSSNFSVVYPEGKPLNPNAGVLTGWDGEIALDIQSAHSMAPKAKILVVASAGQDDEDQIASLTYLDNSHHPLAFFVSNSWENASEIISGSLQEQVFNDVLKTGAADGMAIQFSSGDSGDLGLGTPVGAVMVPSNSPYATAVGGTSILNNPYASNATVVTGWGSDVVYLYDYDVIDPLQGARNGGAGGGQSHFWAKPSWEASLPGSWRQSPDVAALADPATGFPVFLTQGGKVYGQIIGGTSLACPLITSMWAVASQYNGAPLGFAAKQIASAKTHAGALLDVTGPPAALSQYDVTGSITDTTGTHSYTAKKLFTSAKVYGGSGYLSFAQSSFLSAVWPVVTGPNGFYLALSFGTDTSLTTTSGWDNVTGWGEPIGIKFVQAVTGKLTGVVDGK